MKFNQILTGLGFLSSYALASQSCNELKKELKNNKNIIINQCIEDYTGSIETLAIKNKSSDYAEFPKHVLFNAAYYVKKLTLEGFELDDDIVGEISVLYSFEELNLINCIDYDDEAYEEGRRGCMYDGDGCLEIQRHDINWNRFYSLDTLTINDGIDIPSWVIRNYMNEIKNLEINGESPSELSDCKDIRDYLKRKGVENESGVECVEDENGQVTSLKIIELQSDYTEENQIIDRLVSYPSIKTLYFDTKNIKQENINKNEAPNVIIENTSNEHQRFDEYFFNFLFNGVKNLTLKNFEIKKDSLKDIAELNSLKELNLVDCIDYDEEAYEDGKRGCMYDGDGCFEIQRYELNWENLKNLFRLSTLTISNDIDVPTWVIREYKEELKKLKKLEINGKDLSKLSDCEDIKDYLKRKGVESGSEMECVEDKQGRVTSIKIDNLNSEYTNEEQITNRLNSYPTIKTLVINEEDHQSHSSESSGCEEIKKILGVNDDECAENEEGQVSKLTIENREITNDILKVIKKLTNLEELNIINCLDYNYDNYYDSLRGCIYDGDGCLEIRRHVLDWDNLKNLTKLTTLTISRSMDVPTWVIREYKKNMKNLKKLNINGETPSKLSDCDDIKSYLKRKTVREFKMECVEDKQGQVTSLKIDNLGSNYTDMELMTDRLTSYNTIETIVVNGESYDNDIMKAEPNDEMACSPKYGYKCCSHCHSIFSDKDGLWGAEDGQWCVIPDQCKTQYDICWSIEKGYPCCNHCKVALENGNDKWGFMDNDWCGIPLDC